VIRAFSEHRRSLTISQISQKTAIPRAAVRRCLYTLEKLGYVAAHDNAFSLRPQILAVGHAYLASTPLAASAQPYLDRVSELVNESCSAAILDADEVIYIARAAVTHIMSINLMVGTRLPAYCTSMGRVLLASLAEDELGRYLKQLRPTQFTSKTVTSVTRLRELIRKVARDGYAIVDQELEVGLRSIAVPIRDTDGRVIAAMNIGAQAARMSVRDLETQVRPHLTAAARELGALLTG
jgi:IclR family pca regulon transcriptional regulator